VNNDTATFLYTPFYLIHDTVTNLPLQYAPFFSTVQAAVTAGVQYGITLTATDTSYGLSAGLVVRKDTSTQTWVNVIPYFPLMDFFFQGGTLTVYLDPAAAVNNIPPTAVVYKNGSLVPTPSTIPAGTGNWAVLELTQQYVLPTATDQVLGGVKVGTNLKVASDGTLSVPVATSSTAGAVIAGSNLTIDGSGTLNVPVATDSTAGIVTVGSGLSVTTGTVNLAAATGTTLGGIKVGANVTVQADGTISVAAPYVLPPATSSALGGVKQGTNVNIASDGTLNVPTGAGYVLPAATTSAIGGVIIPAASGLSVDSSGNLSIAAATNQQLGGVKIGANINVSGGVISVAAPYVLPAATTSALGGVIPKGGLDVTSAGVLNAKTQTVFRQQTWAALTGGTTEPDVQTAFTYTLPANTLAPNGKLEFTFTINDPHDAGSTNTDGSFKYATKQRGVRLVIGGQVLINDVVGSPGAAGFNIWSIGTTDSNYNAASWAASTFLNYEVLGTIWRDSAGKAFIRVNYNIMPPNANFASFQNAIIPLNVDFTQDQVFQVFADFQAKDDQITVGHCEVIVNNI
jgi:hypothetical protein